MFFAILTDGLNATDAVIIVLGAAIAIGKGLDVYKKHFTTTPEPEDTYLKKDDYNKDVLKERDAARQRRKEIHDKIESESKSLDSKIEAATAQIRQETKDDTAALRRRIDQIDDDLRREIAGIPSQTIALLKNTGAIKRS